MKARSLALLAVAVLFASAAVAQQAAAPITGFRDPAAQHKLEDRFLAVPDAARAGEHLRILTAEPHLAGTSGDFKTAEYVAEQYRKAGLETEIVEYKVWMNYPGKISVLIQLPDGRTFTGPTPEHVAGDPFQSDPRVVTAYNGFSPSGEVEAEVIYANYGRPEDFRKLKEMGADVAGKIVVVRYGSNFRGVKAYTAQLNGAAGVIIYSDPIDDGYFKGDIYPRGAWRPESAVQRGSIKYIFKYPGDPTTPGMASLPSLPEAQRTPPEQAANVPRIPTTPLSYGDARPILENLGGPESPREWQGALPFTYHVGPGPVRVKLSLKQDFAYRTIWNVIGRVRGRELPEEWVINGNHRDAWVYGAVDPNSGTASQLEAVAGIGELLKTGWRPRRTLIFASWDAEEFGLTGSTEWVEQHAKEMAGVVAYLNIDSAVAGSNFTASAVPSLKPFVREVARVVASPKGMPLYEAWLAQKPNPEMPGSAGGHESAGSGPAEAKVGDLGSGSDYTPFLQHAGVPSIDVSSDGDYGVYHSVFDNFEWFRRFADPEFRYLQQMARVVGIQALRLSEADVLPFDYENYGREVVAHLENAQKKAASSLGKDAPDFTAALAAARRLQAAGKAMGEAQRNPATDAARVNRTLREAERALLLPNGLPNRPWYRHSIYAPGEFTGYAAVVLPGVTEAADAGDAARARQQLDELAQALNRAAAVLESFR
ncbi:MAG TPA: M28 family metallopeptidase [Terriglobales bacterium]|nr:M28 family metallopeptidase [Terriglobales bacterium]